MKSSVTDYYIETPGGACAGWRLTPKGGFAVTVGDERLARDVQIAMDQADARLTGVPACASRVEAGKETILEEAARLTSSDRQKDYGHPLDNHGLTGDLWGAWLERRFRLEGGTLELTAEDVCDLNALQKLSREAHARKRDTDVDVCGYMRNKEMARDELARRRGQAE